MNTVSETAATEPTLASVRADFEKRKAYEAEEQRIKTKRSLLESLMHLQPGLEAEYQEAKAHKKNLKEVRQRLETADTADLCVEELSDLVHTVKSLLCIHDGGIIAAVVVGAPVPPTMQVHNHFVR